MTAIKTKVNFFVTLLVLTSLTLACNGEDNMPPISENQPPAQFNLLTVGNTSTNIDLLPELSWETAVDPEGDNVTYTVFLDTATDPQSILMNGVTDTSFAIVERLELNTIYYWKVSATDSNDNTTDSETFSFSTRNLRATLLTSNAGFSPRVSLTSSVFQDKVWIIGGSGPDGSFVLDRNDIWSSEDGINWTLEVVNAPFR